MDMTRVNLDGAERTSPPPTVDLNTILGTDRYRPRMAEQYYRAERGLLVRDIITLLLIEALFDPKPGGDEEDNKDEDEIQASAPPPNLDERRMLAFQQHFARLGC